MMRVRNHKTGPITIRMRGGRSVRLLPGVVECDDEVAKSAGFRRLEQGGVIERISSRVMDAAQVAEIVDPAVLQRLAKGKDAKVREAAKAQLEALSSKPADEPKAEAKPEKSEEPRE